jgi:hypothetical protein
MRLRITLDIDIEDEVQPDDVVQHLIDTMNDNHPNTFPEVTGVNDAYWKWGEA